MLDGHCQWESAGLTLGTNSTIMQWCWANCVTLDIT